jgi:toxin-antitoxin system PIN domain toxin
MTANLFDVNFLIALAWPNHLSHASAVRWFEEHAAEPFATCPLTETGFIRISMNPLIVGETAPLSSVLTILSAYKELPGHLFWEDDPPTEEALSGFPTLSGHRQITDAYLLALAIRKGGRLITFDRGIGSLADSDQRRAVVVCE